jgi:cold shock CspA family protein
MMAVVKTGKLKTWKDDRGFGFIRPDDGGKDVFIHISALKDMSRRPNVGDIIHYQVGTDSSGKIKATLASIQGVARVAPSKPRSHQPRQQQIHSRQRPSRVRRKANRYLQGLILLPILFLIFTVADRLQRPSPTTRSTPSPATTPLSTTSRAPSPTPRITPSPTTTPSPTPRITPSPATSRASSPTTSTTTTSSTPSSTASNPAPTSSSQESVVGQSGCNIKGNISQTSGRRLYHLPGMEDYENTIIRTENGERWFCSEQEAINNGWVRAPR